jgi:hypothetical protein
MIALRRVFVAVLAGFVGFLPAQAAFARSYKAHIGYIADVVDERDERVEDVVVFEPPPPEGPDLNKRIFNEQLTREFTDRYHEKFGYTEQQRAYLAPNQHTYYNDQFSFRGTAEQTDEEKRKFAEFMLRRLTEFHVENYMKSDPKTRAVWEAKEKLSNVKMKVGNNIRITGKYSISGNNMDLIVKNPWVDSKVVLHMKGAKVDETVLSLSRPITKTLSAESHYKFRDGIVTLVGSKALSPGLSTTLTTSTYTNHAGTSPRESVYLAGLSYSY